MRSFLVTLLVLIALAASANAWWCTGHMAIVQIAKENLDSGVYSQVESIITALSAAGPFPKSPDFVQAACWADDLKSYGLEAMAGWHFINQPYDPSGYPIAKWPVQDENVEKLIMQLGETAKKNPTPAYDLAFALANLIHFYGDIHQPLHATELFSATYPTGDYGGNAQDVTVDGTATKLHFVWDAICWEYHADVTRPLSSTDYTMVKTLATYLQTTYTFSDSQKKEWNSTIMAQESFNDAVQYAYPGTYSGMTISSAYLAACKPIAEARVALAGYRLASELNYIFGSGEDVRTGDAPKRSAAKKIREHIARSHVRAGNFAHAHLQDLAKAHKAKSKSA